MYQNTSSPHPSDNKHQGMSWRERMKTKQTSHGGKMLMKGNEKGPTSQKANNNYPLPLSTIGMYYAELNMERQLLLYTGKKKKKKAHSDTQNTRLSQQKPLLDSPKTALKCSQRVLQQCSTKYIHNAFQYVKCTTVMIKAMKGTNICSLQHQHKMMQ